MYSDQDKPEQKGITPAMSRCWLLVSAAIALIGVAPHVAHGNLCVQEPMMQAAPTVACGSDYFQTVPLTFIDLPVIGRVPLQGLPLNPARFGQTDTIVQRLDDAVINPIPPVPPAINSPAFPGPNPIDLQSQRATVGEHGSSDNRWFHREYFRQPRSFEPRERHRNGEHVLTAGTNLRSGVDQWRCFQLEILTCSLTSVPQPE